VAGSSPSSGSPSGASAKPFGDSRAITFHYRLSAIWLSLSGLKWLLIPILALAWVLRARNPHFSSAYMDESVYILYGRMFLSHHFESPIDQPLHFSFGWYLWPILAAWADRIRGLVGVRELSAALGTLTVWCVYGFARRVFSPAVGVASALIFALLGPAVFASRIATRDIGCISFFAVGLWLFIRAWQEQEWLSWFGSAIFLFAAFLSKYLIAIYFPFLVIASFWKWRRSILAFSLPLTLFCAAYAYYYRSDLIALLQYAHAYGSLKAPADQAWQIYFTHRADFWILVGLSAFAWLPDLRTSRWSVALLFVGAAILPVFQAFSRADYDYWKHVNYSFLFLVPLGMQGLLLLLRRLTPHSRMAPALFVVALAVCLGWAGNAWAIDRFLFWPNTEPAVAYFEGRLASSDRILVDDTVFRYYFSPPLHQWQLVDPFYFRYGSDTGAAAYAHAAHDGFFDFIVLDGGIGDDAKRLRAAIAPELAGRYALQVSMPDPVLGQRIEIYERRTPPAAVFKSTGPQIEITSPSADSIVQTQDKAVTLAATLTGVESGDYVVADVFTNHWYPQGGKIFPTSTKGTISKTIYLAGEGHEQCYHIVRLRLFDPRGRFLASALNFNIARANADGSAPSCR
jgi:Dolichyl-phosphate-mannose-protein mannosyltransferase